MSDYSLMLYGSVLDGAGFSEVLADARGWRRSVRLQGGYWQGSFTLLGETSMLADAFYNWLGWHIVERSGGGTTWEGLIYEMTFTHRGISRRRSLDLLYNAVTVDYQANGEVTTAAWATADQSIARYGRREERLSLDNAPSATATAYRSRWLATRAWPYTRPVSINRASDSILEIRVCGYGFTAAWLFAAAGDGTDHNVNHWISAIVGTAEGLSSDHGGSVSGAGDCQFLSAGSLATNTLQVPEVYQSDIRAWAKILELAGLGDASGNPWRVWVGNGRRLHYAAIDLTPRYHLRDDGLYDRLSSKMALSPWLIRPGVMRDFGYRVGRKEPGSMLNDARDILIEEVEVSEEGIAFKTGTFDEAAIMAAQSDIERYL